jgi:hypothetical protein
MLDFYLPEDHPAIQHEIDLVTGLGTPLGERFARSAAIDPGAQVLGDQTLERETADPLGSVVCPVRTEGAINARTKQMDPLVWDEVALGPAPHHKICAGYPGADRLIHGGRLAVATDGRVASAQQIEAA